MIGSFQFSPAQFLRDMKVTADAIGAAYSEPVTRTVLGAYAGGFRAGAVLWRTTDRPSDALNYRFYERRPTDSIGTAIRAGLLDPNNTMTGLISSWSSLYGGTSTELCDFDAEHGIAKTWVYLGGMRPVEHVLGAPGVPWALRRHERRFRALGLACVRHVAVDYRGNTANLYFRTSGKITRDQSERFVSLANGKRPGPSLFSEMERFTPPDGYTFSVTMAVGNGDIQRVGFYALKLPAGRLPTIGQRLATFFQSAPSRDDEEMNAIAWSFGPDGKDYIKAERSYCGRLVALMKTWNSPMTDAS
jgi:4-hydroxyphenylpyruvate 3-dimethylallyltransferase